MRNRHVKERKRQEDVNVRDRGRKMSKKRLNFFYVAKQCRKEQGKEDDKIRQKHESDELSTLLIPILA